MHLSRLIAVSATACLTLATAHADDRMQRRELNRADLTGIDGTEVIVARLELAPGGTVPLHTHHGDEHSVVVQGGTLTTADGKEVHFTEGMALFFPRGQVHGGLTVTGDSPVVLYTTHIVDKALNVPAP